MKRNLTPAIEEELLEKTRILAVRRRTTVTRIVRDHLRRLVEADDAAQDARRRLKARMRRPGLDVGPRTWTREALRER